MTLLLTLATLPFLAKAAVLATGVTGYLAQSLYKIFQLLIPCCWRRMLGKRGLSILWPVEEPLPSLRTWLIATGAGVALSGTGIVFVLALSGALGIDPAVIREGLAGRFGVSGMSALAVVVFLAVINAAIEELHFRAWLDREISMRIGNKAGIGISASAFALMHSMIFAGLPGISVPAIALACMALVIAGVTFSLVMRRPGGIHAAWLCHGIVDVLLLGWGLFWLGFF